MAEKIGNSHPDQSRQKKWLCSKCGYGLAVLLNDSCVLLYQQRREFKVTYESISTKCPKCGSIQEKVSPLLDVAIEETIARAGGTEYRNDPAEYEGWVIVDKNPRDALISMIRIKAWGVKDYLDFIRTFPVEGIEMSSDKREGFKRLLSQREKDAYEIMRNNFSGFIGDEETTMAIKEKMNLPSVEEADRLHSRVVEKLRKFKQEKPS